MSAEYDEWMEALRCRLRMGRFWFAAHRGGEVSFLALYDFVFSPHGDNP